MNPQDNNPVTGQPDGQNQYNMNQGYGMDRPGDVTQPFQATDAGQGFGMNSSGGTSYGMNQQGAANQGYGANQNYGANQGYGMNQQAEAGQGYGMNQPGAANQNYGANQGYGTNQNYGANQGYGTNQDYGANQGYGMNQNYGANQGYGANQNYGMNQQGGYTNPQYGYNVGGPLYQQAQQSNKKKLGVVVGVIAAIFVAIVGIIVGVVVNGRKDDPDGEDALIADNQSEESTPTPAEPTEEPTPEPTQEPTEEPTPEPTEEPTAEPTEEPGTPEIDPDIAVDNSVTDYRASFTGYYGEDYILIKNNQWDDYKLTYADTQEAYSLSDKDVRYFMVIGGELYYTSRDADSETYSFWKRGLGQNDEPELLLDGTQVCSFSYYGGLIYYDNYDDYYELYCYDPVSGSNTKIDTDSLGYYYILDGYIYYERLDDSMLCKMKLDGTGKETLFALEDYGLQNLQCLTAFNIQGSTFLAFNTPDGEMYLTTEDGSAYELIAQGLEDFDLNQDIYYADGSIYYSAANGMEVHKLDIEDYLTDANMEEIPDTVICNESFYYFEVTDGLIYVELYSGNNEVMVLDYQTGEEYNTFDFS